jgi:mannitol 2-dehydrogenase
MSAPESPSTVPARLTSRILPQLAARLGVPTYDRKNLTGGIVHLGVGGFHRAHLAVYLHELATAGGAWSITGSGVTPNDARMHAALSAQDGLYVLIERDGADARGSVIGSITAMLAAHDNTTALIQQLADPTTRIVSMTITEGGYPVEHGAFVETNALRADAMHAGAPRSTFGVLAQALELRRRAGLQPFTVMSCDNLPGNGKVARMATTGAAAMMYPGLDTWLDTHGAFPNAMVDRITPATTNADRNWVKATYGIEDAWPVACEPFRQWALEDEFSAGRPSFEDVGVLMTNDVIPYEHMKLRLLNASHSALAYHAALAGYELVDRAVADPRIERFIRRLMADEAAPNLVAPAGIDLVAYQESLVQRFANPAIGDQIARLCLDGTAKFPTFIVPTVEAQMDRGGSLRMMALTIAGWCRYLRGVADDGTALALSGDPFLEEARSVALASIEDPARFLRYERALGSRMGTSAELLRLFTEALDSLDRVGSMATLDAWTR